MNKIPTTVAVIFILLLAGCQNLFPYSAYTAEIPEEKTERNLKNILRIRPENFTPRIFSHNGNDAVAVALISDTHYWYDETANVADRINRDTTISLTFLGGDITDGGLPKEFLFTADQMDKINTPSLAIIGNHDYLAMGKDYYQKIFSTPEGSCSRGTSYTVTLYTKVGTIRFILFDNNVWEAQNSRPDFEWLDRACRKGYEQADQTIVIAHIPPWDQQMDQGYGWEYNTILEKYSIPLSIHGHLHHGIDDSDASYENSPVRYAIIGSTRYNGYARVVFTENSCELELR